MASAGRIQERENMFEDIIKAYKPVNLQEAADKNLALELVQKMGKQILYRESTLIHTTASSMIFNRNRDKVLMVWHRIYESWSWTGGHSDGESNFLQTAKREAFEETGIQGLKVIRVSNASDDAFEAAAMDILTAKGHMKRNNYVSAHLHLNIAYALEGDEAAPIRVKPDENKDVGWISLSDLDHCVSEKWMLPVYHKIIERAVI